MLGYIKLTEIGPVPTVRRGRSLVNRAKKAGYLAMGRHWHAAIRPEHFAAGARVEYGYQPRKGDPQRPDPYGFGKSYQGEKLKEYGHTRPLEKTGESQAQTRIATVTASSRHVRLSFTAGWLGQANPKHGIDLESELTAISPSDAEGLAQTWLRAYDQALRDEVQRATTNL